MTTKYLLLALCAATLASAGCSQKASPVGTERGPCYGNGTCNEGLACMSELCVKPPPVDCRAVATKLNFLVLGNYAQQSERDAYASEMTTVCKQANLSYEDADCILAAKNRAMLSQCKKPLAMGDCERAVTHLTKVLTGADPSLGGMMDPKPAIRRCQQRGITRQEEDCIVRASTKEQLDGCVRF